MAPIPQAPAFIAKLRAVAAVALLGATVCALPFAGAAAHSAGRAEESVDQRITDLHAALKVTPDEETKWAAVAGAMRDNKASIEKLVAQETAEAAQAPHEATAVDDLKTYQKFAQAHADGLTTLIASFETFYSALPPDQQKLADQVFANFGHKGASAHHKA